MSSPGSAAAPSDDPIFQRSTNRVRQVLAFAQQAATRQGEPAAGVGLLLLGLVQEGGGVAAQALARQGIDAPRLARALAGEPVTPMAPAGRLDSLARTVRAWFAGRGQRPTPVSAPITLDSAADRAWRQADAIRRQRGEEFLATEHLLLGLIDDERGDIGRLLAAFGTSATAVRGTVWQIIENAMRRGGGV